MLYKIYTNIRMLYYKLHIMLQLLFIYFYWFRDEGRDRET